MIHTRLSTYNKKNLMGPILFLYYEESLVSSNLNSKLFWFHCVRPNVHTMYGKKNVWHTVKYCFPKINTTSGFGVGLEYEI